MIEAVVEAEKVRGILAARRFSDAHLRVDPKPQKS
jgi:hypothetical protein